MASTATLGVRGAELFRAQAALYASHRPSYPAELFEAVLSFAGLQPGRRQLALDVATGTGQVGASGGPPFRPFCRSNRALGPGNTTRTGMLPLWLAAQPGPKACRLPPARCRRQVATALAERFDAVLACDASQQQLDHAEQRPNITYFLSPAERLDRVAKGSVDLLTVAQALHWWVLARALWGRAAGTTAHPSRPISAELVGAGLRRARAAGTDMHHSRQSRKRQTACIAARIAACITAVSPCAAPTLRARGCLPAVWTSRRRPRLPERPPAARRRRFDLPAFLREARRVLCPGGTLAVWGELCRAGGQFTLLLNRFLNASGARGGLSRRPAPPAALATPSHVPPRLPAAQATACRSSPPRPGDRRTHPPRWPRCIVPCTSCTPALWARCGTPAASWCGIATVGWSPGQSTFALCSGGTTCAWSRT